MAFPAAAGSATSNISTATTAPVINLPGSISAGDLLLGIYRTAGTSNTIWPAGWTEVIDDSSDGSDDVTSIAHRWADGTEGATITLTTNSHKGAGIVYRITGAENPSTQAPEFSAVAANNSTQPNPSNVTPTGGAKDYLFIWIAAYEGEQGTPGSPPTNYSGVLTANSGTGGSVTTNCRVTTAWRQLNAASEDPTFITLSAADDWTAWVVAIHPAGSGALNVTPALLGTASLLSPAVQPGAVTVAPALLGTASLLTPASILHVIKVFPPLLGGATLHAPTFVLGNVNVAPSLLGGATIPAPTVAVGGGTQTVTPALLGLASLLSPAVQPGSVSVSPALLGLAVLHSPTLALGAVTVSPARLGPAVLNAPTINVSGVGVGPALLGGAQLFAPTFKFFVSPDRLGLATLLSPSIGRSVVVARLGGAVLHSPSILSTVPVAGKVTMGHALAWKVVPDIEVLSEAGHELIHDVEESHG